MAKMKVITVRIAVPEDEAKRYADDMIDNNPTVQEAPHILEISVRNPNNDEKREIKRQREENPVSWTKPKK